MEMENVLDRLWDGEICKENAYCGFDKQESEILECMNQCKETITTSGNAQLTEALLYYLDCAYELNNILEKRIFSYGFHVGAQFAAELKPKSKE